eukprot:gene9796-7685_t
MRNQLLVSKESSLGTRSVQRISVPVHVPAAQHTQQAVRGSQQQVDVVQPLIVDMPQTCASQIACAHPQTVKCPYFRALSGKIEPSDICQGSLGNCWLMSACACLASIDGAVEQVFKTKEVTAYGRYSLRMYDGCKKKFETIVIDDWIPCDRKSGGPVFAKPNGDEAWVLLLEKAFAKFKGTYSATDGGFTMWGLEGTYSATDGGFTMWGLEVMTGNTVFKFSQEGSGQLPLRQAPRMKSSTVHVYYVRSVAFTSAQWQYVSKTLLYSSPRPSVAPCITRTPIDPPSMVYVPPQCWGRRPLLNINWSRLEMVHGKSRAEDVKFRKAGDVLTNEEMFKYMLTYSRKGSVIAASSGAGEDTKDVDGIVQGHAYSVIKVKEVGGHKLLQLRNPWGSFEWKGNWSDKSAMWQQNPKVARALDFVDADDGMFWIDWKDFNKYYKDIDFCLRTTGWNDLTLDIHEECCCIGPSWGCLQGCMSYWFCCKGCGALFCSQQKQEFEKAEKGCCAC